MADVPPKLRSEPGLSLPCHGQRGKPRCFAWFTIAIIVKSFDRRDTANSALYASGFALNTHPSMNEHEHVHPDISRMLLTEYDTNLVDLPYDVTGSMTLTLRRAFNTTTLPDSLRIDQLANLADECEGAISRSKKSMPPTQLGLIRLSECGENDGASHLVASMMALNRLESAIRRTVSGDQPAKQGSAPLKDLIERLYEMEAKGSSSTSLAPVLRTLLLPTKSGGINLRNLVLHGFLSEISAKWFSLALIILNTLEEAVPTKTNGNPKSNGAEFSATKYQSMRTLAESGQSILRSHIALHKLECQAKEFVPTSHHGLLRFLLRNLAPTIFDESLTPLSVTFIALMCVLLEHSLRLMWCEANGRHDDTKAQPNTYYVTLDGHGQKTIHDVIVLPFLMNGERNSLVQELGAPMCSLLSDLFTSPSPEAPNIRSAVFHGTFDKTVACEVQSLVQSDAHVERECRNERLADIACVLTSCLESLSKPSRPLEYRPVYSHTASYNRQFAGIFANLNRLRIFIAENRIVSEAVCSMEERQAQICQDAAALYVDSTDLKVMNEMLFSAAEDDTWCVEDLYSEYNTNMMFSSSGASLALLEDTARAAECYIAGLNERTSAVENGGVRDRFIKSTLRYCSVARIVLSFYSFVTYVALSSMMAGQPGGPADDGPGSNDKDWLKAVERSRMTLSTFDAFVSTNLDRSLKALQSYLRGKVIKQLLEDRGTGTE